MDKILIMSQDESNKLTGIIEKDSWHSIKEFLNLGNHIRAGNKAVDSTVELLLIITIAFIGGSFVYPKIKSVVHYRIDAMYREHKVPTPFYQRDIYLFQHIKNQ